MHTAHGTASRSSNPRDIPEMCQKDREGASEYFKRGSFPHDSTPISFKYEQGLARGSYTTKTSNHHPVKMFRTHLQHPLRLETSLEGNPHSNPLTPRDRSHYPVAPAPAKGEQPLFRGFPPATSIVSRRPSSYAEARAPVTKSRSPPLFFRERGARWAQLPP